MRTNLLGDALDKPWFVCTDGQGVLGIFPEVNRANWFSKQCLMFSTEEPEMHPVSVDIETEKERWVHKDKADPPDVHQLKTSLSYVESLLCRLTKAGVPRHSIELDCVFRDAVEYLKKEEKAEGI